MANPSAQLGGTIAVDTALGAGTEFRIWFSALAEGALPPPEEIESHAGGGQGRETVLLVEDEDAVRRLAAEALRRAGYAVLEASNGDQALDLARRTSGPISAVVTDVLLPGMHGVELARHLADQRPDIRVLFISGYAADVGANRDLLDPGTEFLQKPFTPTTLVRRVRTVLDEPRTVGDVAV